VSRGWKIGLGIAAVVVAINVGLNLLEGLTGGSPGGPASSSYSTGDDGARAYAELLSRSGYTVRRVRTTPGETRLDPGTTAVVLGPEVVLEEDARALREFVASGGRLVAGGGDLAWLRELTPGLGDAEPSGPDTSRPLAPVPEVDGVRTVRAGGSASWERTGEALPVVGSGGRTIVAVSQVGRGRALLLADDSPLQNAFLVRDDNARLALGLAGPTPRPVEFFENYHGYGESSGLGAVPDEWLAMLALAFLAVVVLIAARWRRLGPAEPEERDLAPPRKQYVESLGSTLERTRDPAVALAGLKADARRRLARRTGSESDAAAARRLGLEADEADAVTRDGFASEDVLPLGRALARLASSGRRQEDAWQG
jgi:hypothetical protein